MTNTTNILFVIICILLLSACRNHYYKGIEFLNQQKYDLAIMELASVNENSRHYKESLVLIDSIKTFINEEHLKIQKLQEKYKIDQIYKSLNNDGNWLNYFRTDIYRDDLVAIGAIIKKMNEIEADIDQAILYRTETLLALAQSVEKQLQTTKNKYMPEIRKKFQKAISNDFDLSARLSGNQYTTITLTSIDFHRKSNIEDTHKNIRNILIDLGFEKVIYKEIEDSDQVYYYNLKSSI